MHLIGITLNLFSYHPMDNNNELLAYCVSLCFSGTGKTHRLWAAGGLGGEPLLVSGDLAYSLLVLLWRGAFPPDVHVSTPRPSWDCWGQHRCLLKKKNNPPHPNHFTHKARPVNSFLIYTFEKKVKKRSHSHLLFYYKMISEKNGIDKILVQFYTPVRCLKCEHFHP